MSYVLEALKRADAERERGAVPGLHAQPVPLLPAEPDARRAGVPWLWLGVGLALGLLGAFAWLLSGREPVVVQQPVVPQPAPVVQGEAVVPQPVVPPPAAVTPQPAAVAPQAAPAPPAVARLPAVAMARPAPARAEAPASAAAEPAVLSLNELPESVRRELPALSVGGAIYSNDPAQRFLILNGRVVHEKEEVSPGLRLEQIKLKSAVLRYKDVRYSISF